MRYPFTFITNKFIPKWAAACAIMGVILIRPEYENDEGLYQHELTHVKQWFSVTLILGIILFQVNPILSLFAISAFSVLYETIAEFRLQSEVMAYKKQLEYYNNDKSEKFAGFITDDSKYKLEKHTSYTAVLNKLRKK